MKYSSLKKPTKGFTLIEMLMVVIIIGLLVSIAVPAINTAKSDAQAAKRQTICRAIETAKLRYVLNPSSPVWPKGAYVTFNDIKPYLLINGATPNLVQITDGTQNGAGISLCSFGIFQTTYSEAFPQDANSYFMDGQTWMGPLVAGDEGNTFHGQLQRCWW